MNQILYTGKSKKSNTNMNKTIIFFAVFIIIFAICLISIGTYIFSKTKTSENNNENIAENEILQPLPEESTVEIYFSSVPGKVQVNIESKKQIESVTYRWDEEEETAIEIGDDKYNIEAQIETKQGTHILYITVIDVEGNIETKEQKVIGDSKPEVKISTDGVSNYVITAKDDEKITKIIIDINGVKTEVEVNEKEYEYKIAIPEGDSIIEVTAYNINNLTTIKKAKITGFVK